MWKLICTIVLIILLVPSNVVLADTSDDITVTARGYVEEPGAPSGLTLTYISDYEVGISWTKGEGAENTMIRASYVRIPESRTDGYLVYYGDGESTSDTGVSLEESFMPVNYRAWSEDPEGVWEDFGVSDSFEGVGMTIFAVVAIILAFMVMGFVFKNGILFLASSLGWVLFAFLMFGKVFDNPAMNTGLLLFGGAMSIVTAVLALRMIMGERPHRITADDEQEAFKHQIQKITGRKK